MKKQLNQTLTVVELSKISFQIVLLISAVITMVLNAVQRNEISYRVIAFLPMLFSFYMMFFLINRKKTYSNFTFLLVMSLMYIRMVLTPLLIYLSHYKVPLGSYTIILNTSDISKNILMATLLLFWESIFIMAALFISRKKFKQKKSIVTNIHYKYYRNYVPTIFTLGSLLFVVFVLLRYTLTINYFSSFYSLIVNNDLQNRFNLNAILSSTPRVIYRLFTLFVEFIQIIVPIYILGIILKTKKIRNNRSRILMVIAISILLMMVITPERYMTLLIIIGILIISRDNINSYYSNVFSKLIVAVSAISFVLLIYVAGLDYQTNIFEYLSGLFNAYFSGIINVSIGLNLDNNILLLFNDTITSVPFYSYFYPDVSTSPIIYNYFIKGNQSSVTKIIPLIVQGKLYLGYFLAPLFSFIIIRASIIFEDKYRESKYFANKFILLQLSILFAITPFVYNWNILLSIAIKYLIVLLLFNIGNYRKHI